MIAEGAEFTVKFIQKVEGAKMHVLAALFDNGEGMIDGVLGGINYNDYDLYGLTRYRPELAGSPEKFFRVLDKIKDPEMQEMPFVWVSRSVRSWEARFDCSTCGCIWRKNIQE